MESKKNGTIEPIYKTEIRVTVIERKLRVTSGRCGGWER